MLQKGFLKPQENVSAIKHKRTLFYAGIVIIVGSLFGVMTYLNKGEQIPTLCIILLIGGFFMLASSFWMNFFVQHKKFSELINENFESEIKKQECSSRAE